MTVGERFETLLSNLTLTNDQRSDGITKHTGVRNCLNQHYYNLNNDYAHSILFGSWGKDTQVRPPRDIDVLFILPDDVFLRFHARQGNQQSQLLQEVKSVLLAKYPQTDIRGDGPVVAIPFASYNVELMPAFTTQGGQCLIPLTTNGGTFKIFDPDAEINKVKNSDAVTAGNNHNVHGFLCRCCARIQSPRWWLPDPRFHTGPLD